VTSDYLLLVVHFGINAVCLVLCSERVATVFFYSFVSIVISR
jgi:hypothetical protein